MYKYIPTKWGDLRNIVVITAVADSEAPNERTRTTLKMWCTMWRCERISNEELVHGRASHASPAVLLDSCAGEVEFFLVAIKE